MKNITLCTATHRGIERVEVRVVVSYKPGSGRIEFPETSDLRSREARVRIQAAATSMTPLCSNVDVSITYRDPQSNLPLEHEPAFDLVAGIGLMVAWGYSPIVRRSPSACYIGELGFDGSVRPVRGIVVRVAGVRNAVIPRHNSNEFANPPLAPARRTCVDSLADALLLAERPPIIASSVDVDESPMKLLGANGSIHDGEELLGDALLHFAEGRNLLLLGRPGSGKTMVARRLATRLNRNQPLSTEHACEVAKIHSVAGLGTGIVARPFRAPHHTVSEAGLLGGNGRPGEVSLAHRGVLYLDELTEFRASSIDSLGTTLRNGKTLSSAVKGAWTSFPACPVVVGSAAACPCGRAGRLGCRCERAAPGARFWMDRLNVYAKQLNMAVINMDEYQS